jgi:outer membrane receptor protein involved in Fe transport
MTNRRRQNLITSLAIPLLAFSSGALRAQGPANGAAPEKALFEEMPVVEGAALHAQTLEEAPASVTIISAADIRRYGYRTLGEALSSVPGVYVTYDRIYHYVGVSGFNIPGDYNTRFLVLLNGHPLTENIYNSNGFFGQDFGLDMNLVQRIEFIRGPSSALYGSNGILATINIVTKSPVDQQRFRASSEVGSFGEKKVTLSTSSYLGKGVNLLLSGSFFHNEGQDLHFDQFDGPGMNSGNAAGVDGERGYHTFANLVWKDWSFTAYFNNRVKRPPVPWGDSLFPDTGSRVRDSRNFLTSSYTRAAGRGEMRWQISYDNYRYDDRFDYADEMPEVIDDIRTMNRGDWLDTQLTYRIPLNAKIALTSGAQLDWELRNLQIGYQAAPGNPEFSHVSRPDRTYALFEQAEWSLSSRWKAVLGLRFDDSWNFGHFLSPRLALIYQQTPQTVYKFVYGRPYRNPSTFERYYTDDGYSSIDNPALRPETAHTFEASVEHKFGRRVSLVADFYQYRVNGMIAAVFVGPGVQQYQNSTPDRSTGAQVELSGKLWRDLEAAGSIAVNISRDIGLRDDLPNSPRYIGKFRAAKPLLKGFLTVASSTQYLSSSDTIGDDALRQVLLEDITLTTHQLNPNFDLRFGLRNAFNWHYENPIYLLIDRMRQDGRSWFLELIWRTRE